MNLVFPYVTYSMALNLLTAFRHFTSISLRALECFFRTTLLSSPIMSSETVRCSLPVALMAPMIVPEREEQTPAKATHTMNQRMEICGKAARFCRCRTLLLFS